MSEESMRRFHERVAKALRGLSALLMPGAKLTPVCRYPDDPDADIAIGNDTWAGAIEALQRSVERERNGP